MGAVGAGALLTGCTDDGSPRASAGRPSAADRLRARAARDSADLVTRYEAVIAAHPALAERLRPLRAEVVRHREAFGGTGPRPSGTPSATGSAARKVQAPEPVVTAVPEDEKEARTMLAGAERELADRRAAALLDAPGELARLLASVSAAGAAHAYLLTDGDR